MKKRVSIIILVGMLLTSLFMLTSCGEVQSKLFHEEVDYSEFTNRLGNKLVTPLDARFDDDWKMEYESTRKERNYVVLSIADMSSDNLNEDIEAVIKHDGDNNTAYIMNNTKKERRIDGEKRENNGKSEMYYFQSGNVLYAYDEINDKYSKAVAEDAMKSKALSGYQYHVSAFTNFIHSSATRPDTRYYVGGFGDTVFTVETQTDGGERVLQIVVKDNKLTFYISETSDLKSFDNGIRISTLESETKMTLSFKSVRVKNKAQQ